jgi:hypothetical protein
MVSTGRKTLVNAGKEGMVFSEHSYRCTALDEIVDGKSGYSTSSPSFVGTRQAEVLGVYNVREDLLLCSLIFIMTNWICID